MTAAVLLAPACGSDPVQPVTAAPLPYTVSGTLRNASGATVPNDARVVLVWSGDDGSGDYSYVWGSGPVDVTTGKFTVVLTQNPPAAATFVAKSGARLGVGFPVLVPGGAVPEGRVGDPAVFNRVLGAAGQHAVIYLEHTTATELGWANMRAGYNVGRGVPAKAGQTWDTFERVGESTIELVVDALKNIKTVNWS